MAHVKLELDVPMFRSSRDGVVYYVRNGQQIARGKVKPVFPRSPAQLVNVMGISAASKAWRNTLTPEDIATWSTPCVWGWPGSPWMQAIWSIIMWIWRGIPPVAWTGVCPDPCCSVSIAITPSTGSMLVTVCSALGSSYRGYVAVTPPTSPGKVPTVGSSRILAVGVEPGSSVEIGSAYLLKFGRFPIGGSIGVATRFADITTGSATAVCYIVYPVPEEEVIIISPSSMSESISNFSPTATDSCAWTGIGAPTTSCSWSISGITNADVTVPAPTALDELAVWQFDYNGSGTVTQVGTIRADSDQTSAFAEIPVTVISTQF